MNYSFLSPLKIKPKEDFHQFSWKETLLVELATMAPNLDYLQLLLPRCFWGWPGHHSRRTQALLSPWSTMPSHPQNSRHLQRSSRRVAGSLGAFPAIPTISGPRSNHPSLRSETTFYDRRRLSISGDVWVDVGDDLRSPFESVLLELWPARCLSTLEIPAKPSFNPFAGDTWSCAKNWFAFDPSSDLGHHMHLRRQNHPVFFFFWLFFFKFCF